MGGEGGLNQAYSRLSTTHGHITDCKLDTVVAMKKKKILLNEQIRNIAHT